MYIKIWYEKYVYNWSIGNKSPKDESLENTSFKRDQLKTYCL
jgi:hypothetical protein